VEASSDDSGWAHLGTVGNNIAKQSPEFDARNYGYPKLSALVAATQLFDAEVREVGPSRTKTLYVRVKRTKS
jgi:hypothetical protein